MKSLNPSYPSWCMKVLFSIFKHTSIKLHASMVVECSECNTFCHIICMYKHSVSLDNEMRKTLPNWLLGRPLQQQVPHIAEGTILTTQAMHSLRPFRPSMKPRIAPPPSCTTIPAKRCAAHVALLATQTETSHAPGYASGSDANTLPSAHISNH